MTQIGMTGDELQMVVTEHGLAQAIEAALDAIEGGDNAERALEIAANVFMAAFLEKRELGGGKDTP